MCSGREPGKAGAEISRGPRSAANGSEQVEYADAIKNDDQAFKIQSDAGFILMTTKNGFCRVMTGEGETNDASEQFLQALRTAGGHETQRPAHAGDYAEIDGMIPLADGYTIFLVFTSAKTNKNSGFFGSAFMAHKD